MLSSRMSVTAPEAPTSELPGGHRRRFPWGLVLSVAFLVLVAGTVVGTFRYYRWCEGASGPQTPVAFSVPEGASGSEVADALHEAGVIRCGLVSKWLLRRSDLAGEIRAGDHDLTTNMAPMAAFRALTARPPAVPTVRLTIPEGYRLTQIADRVREVLGIPQTAFLAAAKAGHWSLPPYLPEGTATPEGFLFPETYRFAKDGTTADEVIQRLLDQFGTEAGNLPWGNAKALGVTPYEAVIVASMIEEEAKVQRDRPLIAGVIYNRLREGMPLGIDATLLYDDPTPDGQLSESDLAHDSPYNTRLRVGLPPTPISSPGVASLEAALNPATTRYFYYVLCGADGHHAFAVTYRQHLANVSRCLG
jgi:peptidoglycan lytic transglycosylase G